MGPIDQLIESFIVSIWPPEMKSIHHGLASPTAGIQEHSRVFSMHQYIIGIQ